MAEIVLGIGSSHGPLLSTPPEQWDLRAKADRENKNHWYRGKAYDYESLLKERAPGFAREIEVETRRQRHARCRRAMEVLARKFAEVAPDAVVIVGNDQREFFDSGLTPSITVYRGKEIENHRDPHEPAPGLKIAEVGNAPEEGATYPGSPELASHILDSSPSPTAVPRAPRDLEFRMRTAFCTTPSLATRRPRACLSFSMSTSRTMFRSSAAA
jgi:hypothetical protein